AAAHGRPARPRDDPGLGCHRPHPLPALGGTGGRDDRPAGRALPGRPGTAEGSGGRMTTPAPPSGPPRTPADQTPATAAQPPRAKDGYGGRKPIRPTGYSVLKARGASF